MGRFAFPIIVIVAILAALWAHSLAHAGSDFDTRAKDALCISGNLSRLAEERELAQSDIELELNRRLSERFPRLSFVLKDPDAFTNEMQKRFAEQRLKFPDKPYQFDYSEIGIPIVKDMRVSIGARISELEEIQKQLQEAAQNPSLLARLKSKFGKYDLREIDTAIQYLKDLRKEAESYLAKDRISYQDTIEFASFYSRVIGHFQQRQSGVFARNFLRIDQYLDAYKPLSIEDEYAMYKNRDFSPFQRSIRLGAGGYRVPGDRYAQAITDPSHLNVVLVPTNDELDYDVLLRLMSRKQISLVGVTHEPILADGFLRPGGDFWNHDLRHESAKYSEKINYMQAHRVDPVRERALDRLTDEWYFQLEKSIARISDKDLREATRLLAFNFHHDRGFPMIPSVYLGWKRDGVSHALYAAMKVSGQGVSFGKPLQNFAKADRWLRAFWKEHQAEEDAFLQSK
jgi:hypothetical protein